MDKELIAQFTDVAKDCEAKKEDLIEKVLKFLKDNFKADGLGIRLKENGDYPYYTTLGFSDYFLKAENFLCKRDENGKIIRDEDGFPILECMCGMVLDGKLDKNLPCCTKMGSFFSDGTPRTVSEEFDIDKLNCVIRGKCMQEGYKSVSLIPILFQNRAIGLIQLNSRKENAFPLDLLETAEEMAKILGQVIGYMLTEEQIKAEKKKILANNIKQIASEIRHLTGELMEKYKS